MPSKLKRLVEPLIALLLSPLVLFGGRQGLAVFSVVLLLVVVRGVLRECAQPLAYYESVRAKQRRAKPPSQV